MLFWLVTWCLGMVLLYVVLKFVYNVISVTKFVLRLPGPPSKNWLLGNIQPLYDTPEKMFQVSNKWAKQYYPIYHTTLAFLAVANVVNPYDFEIILTNSKQNKKSFMYDMMEGWLGTGLLTSDGPKWQSRRKILTSSFHFTILQQFIKIFNHETSKLVRVLGNQCHNSLEITSCINSFTLNTIGETAMGTNLDSDTNEYKQAIIKMGDIFIYKILRPWWQINFLYFFNPKYWFEKKLVKILHQFTDQIIKKREKKFKANTEINSQRKRLAMLDLLLTVKNEDGTIDDEGIREEVNTFVFEGHDTTSSAICFALLLLANHRQIQDRIFEEMQQVLGSSAQPDLQSLQELKYMERCVKEVLRMYPSVPIIGRILGEDIVTYSGHTLKAGSIVHLHIYDLHHNPEFFPEPSKFDPDRFLLDNSQQRPPFAFVPFSAGPRNCIGQKFALLEIKAALCGILSEFVLEAVDTPETVVLTVNLVLRPKDGIRVKFVRR